MPPRVPAVDRGPEPEQLGDHLGRAVERGAGERALLPPRLSGPGDTARRTAGWCGEEQPEQRAARRVARRPGPGLVAPARAPGPLVLNSERGHDQTPAATEPQSHAAHSYEG